MDALKSPALQVFSLTRTEPPPSCAAVAGARLVTFSSSKGAVFGGCMQKRLTKPQWTTKTREGSGICTCVAAATAAFQSVSAGSTGTLYSVLGVDSGGSLSQIKSAYKQMARRYHPDVCPPSERDECTQKFLEVRHAYEILSNPEKKAEYDFNLMHPSFAQALKYSTTSSWGQSRRTQGSEGVSDAWRFQWEAQLSRLQHRERTISVDSNSWGARMRQQKSGH